MKITCILVFGLLIFSQQTICQVDPAIDSRLEKREHTFSGTTMPYRLYVPDNYTSDRSYPLILFLHGARWAGTDNVTQLDNELALYWIDEENQKKVQSFVVYPQIPVGLSWENTSGQIVTFPPNVVSETLIDLIKYLQNEFEIDLGRIYVSGKSIGGLGAYGLTARYPGFFAAVVPAAGQYVYLNIENLAVCSMWIFHNKDDNSISVENSRHIVFELQSRGIPFLLTHCNFYKDKCSSLPADSIYYFIHSGATHLYSEFDDSGHQLEPNVVNTPGLYEWLCSQKLRSHVRKDQKSTMSIIVYPNPFNKTARFSFRSPYDMLVNLDLYNILGQKIVTLAKDKKMCGDIFLEWNAQDFPSGIYYYHLTSNQIFYSGSVVLQK